MLVWPRRVVVPILGEEATGSLAPLYLRNKGALQVRGGLGGLGGGFGGLGGRACGRAGADFGGLGGGLERWASQR